MIVDCDPCWGDEEEEFDNDDLMFLDIDSLDEEEQERYWEDQEDEDNWLSNNGCDGHTEYDLEE